MGADPIKSKSISYQRQYAKRFPWADLHHPVPKSRIPVGRSDSETMDRRRSNGKIVFPYEQKAHVAYHSLFWNLKIGQVWELYRRIHQSIFEGKEKDLRFWWLEGCDLESATISRKREDFNDRKKKHMVKEVTSRELRSAWFRAFGGEDLVTAENLLRLTMLFMIFGPEILDEQRLLNNGYLARLLDKLELDGSRLWAFETLFKSGGSVRGIKSKIAHILNRNRNYLR